MLYFTLVNKTIILEAGLIKTKIVNSINSFFIIPIFVLSACYTNWPSKIIKYIRYQYLLFLQNKKVVLIGKYFDTIDNLHINFLKNTKTINDLIFLSKKHLTIHLQSHSTTNFTAIRFVDYVILPPYFNGFKDYNQLLQDIIRLEVIDLVSNDSQIQNKKIQTSNTESKLKVVINKIQRFITPKIPLSNLLVMYS